MPSRRAGSTSAWRCWPSVGFRCRSPRAGYHARVHGRSRDDCNYVCAEDPDGLTIDTLDGEAFPGGQRTPGDVPRAWLNLLADTPVLTSLNIEGFRLMPQSCDMVAVAETFRNVIDGRLSFDEGQARLRNAATGAAFFNGFLHGREGVAMVPRR